MLFPLGVKLQDNPAHARDQRWSASGLCPAQQSSGKHCQPGLPQIEQRPFSL